MKEIKELRKEYNISSAQMASKLKMPPSTYSDKERGRRIFKPYEIIQICKLFNERVENIKNFYKSNTRIE